MFISDGNITPRDCLKCIIVCNIVANTVFTVLTIKTLFPKGIFKF